MPIFHAIVLGIVQGLTEFLPISSSGHLLLVPWLFDWNDFAGSGGKSVEKAFDVALHIGTLIAVVAYFWRDLIVYARDGLRMIFKRREPATPEGRLAWLLVLVVGPGLPDRRALRDTIDEKLGTIPLIAVSLIVFGLLLGFADQRSKRIRAGRELHRQGRPHRRRGAGAGPQPGHVALGHHHHGRPLPDLHP